MVNESRSIRFGVIGVGTGATGTISSLSQNADVRIVAGADVDKGALKRFGSHFGATEYSDGKLLCADPNVDAVYIGAPNHLHAPFTLAALENGKHVIVEKPIAITLAESESMVALAEDRNRNLVVSLPHSYSPPVMRLREMARNREFGSLQTIHSWLYDDWLMRPRTPEELDIAQGGGVTYRQGSHQIDFMRTVAGGLVKTIRGSVGTWDRSRGVNGSHVAYLDFEGEACGTAIFSGYDRFYTAEFNVGDAPGEPWSETGQYRRTTKLLRASQASADGEIGLKRKGRFGGDRRQAGLQYGANVASKSPFGYLGSGVNFVSFEHADVRITPWGLMVYSDDDRYEIRQEVVGGLDGPMIADFCDAIKEGRPPLHDGRWGMATLEACLAILDSSSSGREITLERQVQERL